jgi:LPS sulfotransferase NodH
LAQAGYIICASPRSGSTLLCDFLTRSGAGAPESYFRPASIPGYAERWRVPIDGSQFGADYVSAVRRAGEAGTDRFGMRVMWTDAPAFLHRLAELHPSAQDEPDALRLAFGVRRFVRLSRRDMIAQAVSLVMASQSGLWHLNADGSERERAKPHEEPHYDRAAIAAELEVLRREDEGWTRWFSNHQLPPYHVEYESLSADPSATLSGVAEYLGVSGLSSLLPGTARTAGDLNTEWTARFKRENERR